MSALLGDISRLYDIRRALDLPAMKLREPGMLFPWLRAWPSDILPPAAELPGPPLAVVRINDSSPGRVDLAGLAKALEQILFFLQYLIDLIRAKRWRLNVDHLEQDFTVQRIENAQRLLSSAEEPRKADLGAEERRALLIEIDDRQQRILDAIGEGRVTGVRKLPSPEPGQPR